MSELKKKGLVPELRFPEFRGESEWTEKPLNIITTSIFDGTHQTPKYTEEGIPFFSVENIVSGKSNKFISKNDYMLATSKNKPEKNDVLITRIGNIGFSTVVDWSYEFSIYVTLAVVKSDDRFNSRYLNSYMQSERYQREIQSRSLLNAVPCKINMDELRKTKVLLPELNEQQKIADCLTSIDELVTAHTHKLDALKRYKKGLMQQLFPAEGETEPKLRFPEFRGKGEWLDCSIEDLIKSKVLYPPKDGNHGNIHPKSTDYVDSGIPFVMANDIRNGEVNYERCFYLSQCHADKLQKGFANEGDVLLTHKGTVGEVALIRNIEFPYLMLTPQVTYYRIRNKERLLNTFFLYSFLSEKFQKKLKDVSGGGTRAYVGITEQRKLRVTFPSGFLEQHKVANCLASLDELITTQLDKIETLKKHKQSLMQQLFPCVDEN